LRGLFEDIAACQAVGFIQLLLDLLLRDALLLKLAFVEIRRQNAGLLGGDRVSHFKKDEAIAQAAVFLTGNGAKARLKERFLLLVDFRPGKDLQSVRAGGGKTETVLLSQALQGGLYSRPHPDGGALFALTGSGGIFPTNTGGVRRRGPRTFCNRRRLG
jgi:hypothetical protein